MPDKPMNAALNYAVALMRDRLDVEGPSNVQVIRGYIHTLTSLRAAPAPEGCKACDGDGQDIAITSLLPTVAGRETELRQAFDAGFACCSTQTDKYGEYSGESLDDEFRAWLAALRGGQS